MISERPLENEPKFFAPKFYALVDNNVYMFFVRAWLHEVSKQVRIQNGYHRGFNTACMDRLHTIVLHFIRLYRSKYEIT